MNRKYLDFKLNFMNGDEERVKGALISWVWIGERSTAEWWVTVCIEAFYAFSITAATVIVWFTFLPWTVLSESTAATIEVTTMFLCHAQQLRVYILFGLLQNFDQIIGLFLVFISEESVGNTFVFTSTCTTNTMDVILRTIWIIEIDNVFDIFDICSEFNLFFVCFSNNRNEICENLKIIGKQIYQIILNSNKSNCKKAKKENRRLKLVVERNGGEG